MKKPTIYLPANFGGGARKSTSMAHLTYALQEQGKDPIIVALDTNEEFTSLLDPKTKIVSWDINNEEESKMFLEAVLKKSAQSDQPIVMDIAARGGKTKGIFTILRTQLLAYCHVVCIAPVKPSNKDVEKAIEALEVIEPNEWILVKYDSKEKANAYKLLSSFGELLKMNPSAIIEPDELTNQEAQLLVKENILLPNVEVLLAENPFGNLHLAIFKEHWARLLPQYNKAISKTQIIKANQK